MVCHFMSPTRAQAQNPGIFLVQKWSSDLAFVAKHAKSLKQAGSVLCMPYTSHSVAQEKQKDNFFPHFFLLFKCSWLHFRPISLPTPPHPLDPTPFPFVHVSFIHVLQKSCPLFPHYPYRPLFWLLSVSSLFQCFVLYFACFFVLFTSCPL